MTTPSDASDAALGPATADHASDAVDQEIARRAWDLLAHVYDPEIGIDVVNLGLVYELTVAARGIHVLMTLTTPGCPMSDSLPDAVARALGLIPGVDPDRIAVDVVWEPRWEPERMSDFAKLQLGWR